MPRIGPSKVRGQAMRFKGLARPFAIAAALAVVPAGAVLAQDAGVGAVEGFFGAIEPCHILAFSADGYLGQLTPLNPELTPENIDRILAETANEFRVPQPRMTRAYQPGEYPHLRWPYDQQFRSDLAAFRQALLAAGVTRIATEQVVATAEAVLQRRIGAGDCYPISVMATMSNEFESIIVAALPPATQQQIEGYFRHADALALTGREQDLLGRGIVDRAEAGELRAIAAASQVLEFNTFLINDVGGYAGNLPVEGQLRTTCRNEMQTYYFFLRRLARRGLLQHFEVEDSWAYRRGVFDGHDAAVLRSRRTGEFLVVDSWHDRGGYPARILTLTDWLARRDQVGEGARTS